MAIATPPTQNIDLAPGCEMFKVFTALPEKFVVDFANGIDVARDHLRVQRQRGGLAARMWDGFTGKSSLRQGNIQASMVDGLDGSLRWLTELTKAMAQSNQALSRVLTRVGELQANVALLANYSADTRELLVQLDRRLVSRTDALAREIERISMEQRAERQLNQVFDKWSAGTFEMLPPLARLSACLEELFWGDFGGFCQARRNPVLCDSLIGQLVHKSIARLNEDMKHIDIKPGERLDTQIWLSSPAQARCTIQTAEAQEALQYLGDWADAQTHPFTHCVTQRPSMLPLQIPRLMLAERATTALVRERFVEGCHV
jgi:hypothetical protein